MILVSVTRKTQGMLVDLVAGHKKDFYEHKGTVWTNVRCSRKNKFNN